MVSDEKKILTHLLHRSCRADSSDIERAWEFDDFDAALSSLIEKGYVKKADYKNKKDCSCRLTQTGIEALKEA